MIKQTNNMPDNTGASSTNLDVSLFENNSAYFFFSKKIYNTFKNCHINIYHWVTFLSIVIPEKWEIQKFQILLEWQIDIILTVSSMKRFVLSKNHLFNYGTEIPPKLNASH